MGAFQAGSASSKLGATAVASSVVAKAFGSTGTKIGLKIGATTGGAVTGGFLGLRDKLAKLFSGGTTKHYTTGTEQQQQPRHNNLELPYGKRCFLDRMAQQFEDGFIHGHLFARGRLPEWERCVALALRMTETALVTREGIVEGIEAAEESRI